jgi:hypothetical protein
MTKHIISGLLLALLAPAAHAAPYGFGSGYRGSSGTSGFGTSGFGSSSFGSSSFGSPSQQQTPTKGMGWREYYNLRRETNWLKPIGHNFSKPFSLMNQTGSLQRVPLNTVERNVGKRHIAQHVAARFDTTGGFGESVSRAPENTRRIFLHRSSSKSPSIRVAKLTKTKAMQPRRNGGWKVNRKGNKASLKKPALRHLPRARTTRSSWRVK